MTQQLDVVEPPFARRHVQLTVAVIVSLLFLWLLISSVWSARQPRWHQPLFDEGEAAAGHHVSLIQIDLNAAQPRELALLPGVGPILARRIAENRDRLGPFQTIDDLSRVHGIGPKKLAEIRPLCVIASQSRIAGGGRRFASAAEPMAPDR